MVADQRKWNKRHVMEYVSNSKQSHIYIVLPTMMEDIVLFTFPFSFSFWPSGCILDIKGLLRLALIVYFPKKWFTWPFIPIIILTFIPLSMNSIFLYNSIFLLTSTLFVLMSKICSSVTVLMSLNLLLWCRVLQIMKRDALKDPATDPHALHARRLINQVSFYFQVSKH